MGTERNDYVSFHFSYQFFIRSIFWNRSILSEVFPSERNPSVFNFSKQYVNEMERSRSHGAIEFLRELTSAMYIFLFSGK